jgi:hypothetical protein
MITTKNIPSGGGTPKVIQPGTVECKINSITLDKVPYKEGAYNLSLNIESRPMGDDFEGFLIDKDNPDGGRYEGQIGRVRFSEWPYADGETKTGIKISRDIEIVKAIQNICKETHSTEWLEAQDNKHETIEEFVMAFNSDKPFKDKFVKMCVAGREYMNKAGYMNFDLYLPRAGRGQVNMETVDREPSKLIAFDSEAHIKKAKTESVASFSSTSDDDLDVPTTSKVSADFNLDL